MAKTPMYPSTDGDFDHPESFGFTGSAGKSFVTPHLRGARAPKVALPKASVSKAPVVKDFARAAKLPGGFKKGGPAGGCGW